MHLIELLKCKILLLLAAIVGAGGAGDVDDV